ncbi:unnamed protein product [Camellia sinensis]
MERDERNEIMAEGLDEKENSLPSTRFHLTLVLMQQYVVDDIVGSSS